MSNPGEGAPRLRLPRRRRRVHSSESGSTPRPAGRAARAWGENATASFDVAVAGGGLSAWAAAARLAAGNLRVLLIAPPAAARIGEYTVPAGPDSLWGLHRKGVWGSLLGALGLAEQIQELPVEPVTLQVAFPDRRIELLCDPRGDFFHYGFSDKASEDLRRLYRWSLQTVRRVERSGPAALLEPVEGAGRRPAPVLEAWNEAGLHLPFRSYRTADDGCASFLDAQTVFFYGKKARHLSRKRLAIALSLARSGVRRYPGGMAVLLEGLESGILAAGGKVLQNTRRVGLDLRSRRITRLEVETTEGRLRLTATHFLCGPGAVLGEDFLTVSDTRRSWAVWNFLLPGEAVPEFIAPRCLIVPEPEAPPVGENLVILEHAPLPTAESAALRIRRKVAARNARARVSILRAWMRPSAGTDPDATASAIRKAVASPLPFLDRFLIADRFDPPVTHALPRSFRRRVQLLPDFSLEESLNAAEGVRLAERLLKRYDL